MIDYLGFGALLALLALCAWLTWRARRLKSRAARWAGTGLAGLLTLALALVAGAAAYGAAQLSRSYPNPATQLTVARTPERIARGQRLANACVGCHASNSQLPLAGRDFTAGGPPVGTLYAANLTPGGDLKGWSDGEIIRAIREGIHKDGRSLLIMPSQNFRNLSDDDVQALVAFLRSQPPTASPTPPTRINLMGALIVTLSGGAILSAQPPLAGPVTAPPPGPTAAYGQYLATSVGGCTECHGPNLAGRTGGGNGPPGGPALTALARRWSEAEFVQAIRTGKRPDGSALGEEMPWQQISALASDDDLRALYAYLATL